MINSIKFLIVSVTILSFSANFDNQAQSLTWLGTLGGNDSKIQDISADGSVATGTSRNAGGQQRAFRWTQVTGMQDLGTLGGNISEGYGVSADGSVLAGGAYTATQMRAYRWTETGGMEDIGTIGGVRSFGYDISSDGNAIVGWSWNSSSATRAFRWTQSGGMQSLFTLGGSESWSEGVNADGSVVVGRSRISSGAIRAFLWTQSTGMEDLGTLAGTDKSEAYGVSPDGNVVVGATFIGASPKAFRWTQTSGLEDLGTLGGNLSIAYSASDSAIVGFAYNSMGEQRACRWTQSGGIEDLNITYGNLLTGGFTLNIAFNTSDDGRFIVGSGWNVSTNRYEGFILDTEGVTSITENKILPNEISLEQNYPNPFNPSTKISWQSPVSSWQTLKVFDILGNEVATLVDEYREAGRYEITFDARDLTSGIYFYKITVNNFSETRKMILLR